MKVRLYSVFLVLCVNISVYAQGKLMLVGGGSEDENGWSNDEAITEAEEALWKWYNDWQEKLAQ